MAERLEIANREGLFAPMPGSVGGPPPVSAVQKPVPLRFFKSATKEQLDALGHCEQETVGMTRVAKDMPLEHHLADQPWTMRYTDEQDATIQKFGAQPGPMVCLVDGPALDEHLPWIFGHVAEQIVMAKMAYDESRMPPYRILEAHVYQYESGPRLVEDITEENDPALFKHVRECTDEELEAMHRGEDI